MQAWLKSLQRFKPVHKYAINSHFLGDERQLAWSNLGFWQQPDEHKQYDPQRSAYIQACCQLADHLAQHIGLSSQDILFDLGCGQGASLVHWRQHYAVQQLYAVEIQAQCVHMLQQYMQDCPTIIQHSFYHLHHLQLPDRADAVLCIDAAYHGKLSEFLSAVVSIMHQASRLGFHYLCWSDKACQMTWQQRQHYRYLLKAADIQIEDVPTQSELEAELRMHLFKQVRIENLSAAVLKGFSNYVDAKTVPMIGFNLDRFKIQMTAKLCRKLYLDGFIDYVQVSAVYNPCDE